MVISAHANRRMGQRAISVDAVQTAIQYGDCRFSHGSRVYTLTDRSMHRSPIAHLSDRLRGLCVVLSDDGTVITTNWAYRVKQRPGILRKRLLN